MPDITIVPPEAPLVDLMNGAARWEIPIGEHGQVALVDIMPRLVPEGRTADTAITQAARTSYGSGTKSVTEDRGLIRYLARNRHTTPSEMVILKFHHILPIFVARQLIRHRTASVNEYSARYSVLPDRFFRPDRDEVRKQSKTNKQGGDEIIDFTTADAFLAYLDKAESLYEDYEQLVEKGVSREMARIGLPLSIFTEWYWCIDLHNLLHFLSLRMDSHAQKEIRDYADAMLALIAPLVPVAAEAFLDYRLHGMNLSRLEIDAIRTGAPLASDNKREQAEWDEKKKRLGIE